MINHFVRFITADYAFLSSDLTVDDHWRGAHRFIRPSPGSAWGETGGSHGKLYGLLRGRGNGNFCIFQPIRLKNINILIIKRIIMAFLGNISL